MVAQNDTAACYVQSLNWLGHHKSSCVSKKYLIIHMPHYLTKAFCKAHFKHLNSMVRHGSMEFHLKKDCICGVPATEDIGYILVDCKLYLESCLKTKKYWGTGRNTYFLRRMNLQITNKTALFMSKDILKRTNQSGIICRGDDLL